VDDAALGALVHCAPNLEKLILEGSRITKKGLFSHMGSLIHPKHFDLSEERGFLFKGCDMERLAAALPCIEVLKLFLEDRDENYNIHAFSPTLLSREQKQQVKADIETAFRHYCQGHAVPIPLLDFQFPFRVMRVGGRQHCLLSWFEGRMEVTCVVPYMIGGEHHSIHDQTFAASEVHFLDSLRDFISRSKKLEVQDRSFISRK